MTVIFKEEPLGFAGSANRAYSLAEWLKREIPKPDYLVGNLLSTTSRILAYAPTGIGKTMFAMGLSMAAAHGNGFLHWPGIRPARILFIDGEMPRELLQERLQDETQRLGAVPENFRALSKEDCDAMGPLNSPEGQQFVDSIIDSDGGTDFVVFDNNMSLLSGNQKDEESWQQTLPWVLSLTRRRIGQMWIHHTGHDTSHSYGTKTREWQMDTVMRMEAVERPDTDVSFLLSFRDKARRRTPLNRTQFEEVRIALVEGHWVYQRAAGQHREHISPTGRKFLQTLLEIAVKVEQGNLLDTQLKQMFGCLAAKIEDWKRNCARRGLLGANERATFSKYKLELIAGNWIACNDDMVWVL